MGESNSTTQPARSERIATASSIAGFASSIAVAGASSLLDDPWRTRAVVAALVVAMLFFVWLLVLFGRRKRYPITSAPDLEPWRNGLRNVMRQSWVGEGSPLRAIDNLRQDLQLTTDDTWLHDRCQQATKLSNGQVIDLDRKSNV